MMDGLDSRFHGNDMAGLRGNDAVGLCGNDVAGVIAGGAISTTLGLRQIPSGGFLVYLA